MFFKLLEGVLDRPQLAMYSNIPCVDKACHWSICESTKTKCISTNLMWLDWFKWFRFKLRWVKYKASVCSPWNNKIWIQNKMIHPCVWTVVHHKCFTLCSQHFHHVADLTEEKGAFELPGAWWLSRFLQQTGSLSGHDDLQSTFSKILLYTMWSVRHFTWYKCY